MTAWTAILRRHRVVRASAAAIFLYGFAGAATSPYQAVVAIRELGMSDGTYATVALAAAIANVILSIGLGVMSDRFRSFRRPLIAVTLAGVLGYGAIWALPAVGTFALALIAPLALFHATNSLLFGNVRAHAHHFDPAETAVVNALMRMMISLAWVLVPGAVALVLSGRDSMIDAFLIASLLAAACLAVVVLWLEPDGKRHPPPAPDDPLPTGGTGTSPLAPSAGRPDRPAQVRIPHPVLTDLRQLTRPAILLPVLGVALISQVLHVNAAVLPLILTGQAGGSDEDIGLAVGMVAGLEVVFMFMWLRVVRHMHLARALVVAAAVYLLYLLILSQATAPWHVFAASVAAGFAAAGIISLPISYLLDLIRDRPGLSASLIAVNVFLGGAFGAGVFALGTAISGYPLAAVISGVAGVAGALLLVTLPREDA